MTMPDEPTRNPLLKEVPTHLFRFEETIFGMTLPQLLSDLGGFLLIASVTGGLPLIPRIVVCACSGLLVLVLVHVRVQGYTMLVSLALLVRFATLPKKTVWRSATEPRPKGDPHSIQQMWVQLGTLARGIMGQTVPSRQEHHAYWVAFQVEATQSVRFLPEAEQERFYHRFKLFLDGLRFPVKLISQVDSSDPEHDPAFLAQTQAAASLATSPRLQTVQRATLAALKQEMQTCTIRQHFLIVSATSRDVVAARHAHEHRSPLTALFALLSAKKEPPVTSGHVMNLLRNRVSIVTKALASLDVRAALLDDAAFLRVYASSLAPGAQVPSFAIEVSDEPEVSSRETTEDGQRGAARIVDASPPHAASTDQGRRAQLALLPAAPRTQGLRRRWRKRLRGLHRSFAYRSGKPSARFEEGILVLADLVAPTSVTLLHDAVEVDVRGKRRYLRYFELTGYGSELLCGWQEELTALGLPMIVMTRCDPLDSRMMIKKLEFDLTKLASNRIAGQKNERIVISDHKIQGEQTQTMMDALAGRKLTAFAVQMTIGIHAGSRDRLEQRSDYLRAHLQQMQLSARALTRRHDLGWQTCLPSFLDRGLDFFTNLPSTTLCSFVNWSTGVVGTPSGAYLGTTGSGGSHRPVYLNPWDPTRRLPNPHITICGETGMGKSWFVKLLITGLLGNRIADTVILDRDGDYDDIHEFLGPGESQRFNLAGVIPINLLDIPYGPADVDLAEKTDLLAEFIDNHLLVGLALLYGEALSRPEEAFLTAAAREAYRTCGITMEAIWRDPNTLLLAPPVFSDLLAAMRDVPAASDSVRLALLERFEHVSYLFAGQTSVQLDTPLTIFNIRTMADKWYPLLVYVVQTFLMRHRALKRDERYLAYVIEEASFLLKHPAGKRYLETGSRGFRKLGIAQIVVSQQPADFLEEGQVILANSATNIFLGMQRHVAHKLELAEELERVLEEGAPGRAVIRCGREYAPLDVSRGGPLHHTLFTTDERDRRIIRQQRQHQLERAREARAS